MKKSGKIIPAILAILVLTSMVTGCSSPDTEKETNDRAALAKEARLYMDSHTLKTSRDTFFSQFTAKKSSSPTFFSAETKSVGSMLLSSRRQSVKLSNTDALTGVDALGNKITVRDDVMTVELKERDKSYSGEEELPCDVFDREFAEYMSVFQGQIKHIENGEPILYYNLKGGNIHHEDFEYNEDGVTYRIFDGNFGGNVLGTYTMFRAYVTEDGDNACVMDEVVVETMNETIAGTVISEITERAQIKWYRFTGISGKYYCKEYYDILDEGRYGYYEKIVVEKRDDGKFDMASQSYSFPMSAESEGEVTESNKTYYAIDEHTYMLCSTSNYQGDNYDICALYAFIDEESDSELLMQLNDGYSLTIPLSRLQGIDDVVFDLTNDVLKAKIAQASVLANSERLKSLKALKCLAVNENNPTEPADLDLDAVTFSTSDCNLEVYNNIDFSGWPSGFAKLNNLYRLKDMKVNMKAGSHLSMPLELSSNILAGMTDKKIETNVKYLAYLQYLNDLSALTPEFACSHPELYQALETLDAFDTTLSVFDYYEAVGSCSLSYGEGYTLRRDGKALDLSGVACTVQGLNWVSRNNTFAEYTEYNGKKRIDWIRQGKEIPLALKLRFDLKQTTVEDVEAALRENGISCALYSSLTEVVNGFKTARSLMTLEEARNKCAGILDALKEEFADFGLDRYFEAEDEAEFYIYPEFYTADYTSTLQ